MNGISDLIKETQRASSSLPPREVIGRTEADYGPESGSRQTPNLPAP